VSASADEIGN